MKNVLENFQIKTQKNILDSIDGINSTLPRKVDLLTAYTDFMNGEYLDIIRTFWETRYSRLGNPDLLKLGMKLFDYLDQLNKVGVVDDNIKRNAKEFVKIYMKKTFKSLLDVIVNILKNEREKKYEKNSNGKYCTRGPNELFDILSKTFDMIQQNTNFNIFE